MPGTLRALLAVIGAFTMTAASPAAADDEFARFSPSKAIGAASLNHELLDVFLTRLTVEEKARAKVAYSASGVRGRDFLNSYVGGLAAISPARLRPDEQLAYWLNMRNALILAALSERRGSGDLKKLRGDFSAPGELWTEEKVTVDGVSLSIDDIERRIVLAHWPDARVVYGFYQASETGPALRRSSFDGETIWTDLEGHGREFVKKSGGRVRGVDLQAAAIYDWYKAPVFGGSDDSVKAHLVAMSDPNSRAKIEAAQTVSYRPFQYRIEKFEARTTNLPAGSVTGPAPTGS